MKKNRGTDSKDPQQGFRREILTFRKNRAAVAALFFLYNAYSMMRRISSGSGAVNSIGSPVMG